MTAVFFLFLSFFQIGLLSFGGGMAAMPLIQTQTVDLHGWLSLTEFADLVTIAEMTPGPIAVNAATFVGLRVAGIPGALMATLGCVLPSFLIVLMLIKVYEKYREASLFSGILLGLRPAVVGLIACAGVRMLTLALWGEGGQNLLAGFSSFFAMDWVALVLIAAGFFVLRRWKPSPILVMTACGVLGGGAYLLKDRFLG